MEEIEGRDIFADDFIRQEQIIQELETPSEIQRFFEGTTIFITGGTGFFGKILIEKLLRVCWKLNRIYILMRPKKGKSVEERFEEQFEGPLFDPLKKVHPNFKSKVSIIQGDMAGDKEIISEENRQMLIQTVDVVFHCAATVRFDEKLRQAIHINVKATKTLLDMAQEMKNLKAFLHVSTAYSNCTEKEIKEQFYVPPYDYKKITCLLDVLEDSVLDKITPELLGKYPNTYALTKMIGEHVVKEFGKGLPVGIIRPSIVISTYKEPISGWINNYYGPQGVVFGAGLGLLRTLHCDPDVVADMVPVDLVINALIAFAWDLGQTKGDNPNFEKVSWRENLDTNSNLDKTETADEIPILNYVSSERNPITWGEFMYYNYKSGPKNYSLIQLWHSSLTLNRNYYVDRLYRLVCHYFPAVVVDLIAISMKKKPILELASPPILGSWNKLNPPTERDIPVYQEFLKHENCNSKKVLWKSYKKIHKFSEVISYFCTSQWKFREDNTVKLWSKLSPKDKHLFNFDIQEIVWEQYFDCYIKGLRVYLANDALSSLPQGKKRALRLKIYHYILVMVVNLLFFYALYRVFCFLFI